MIYIDSDGVFGRFKEWLYVNGANLKDEESVNKTIINNYERAYLETTPFCSVLNLHNILTSNDNCYILTNIPEDKFIKKYAGDNFEKVKETLISNKYKWFKKRFDINKEKIIINQGSKSKWCKSNQDVLIDDYEENIKEWRETGGVGILINK